MDMNRYDLSKLPLPIRPGDAVFFVIVDTDEIQEDVATSVGINEDGRILIVADGEEYEMGDLDQVFYTRDDAEQFRAGTFEDYDEIDYKKLNLPYYPGTTFYYCDYDPFDGWEIFEEYYTYVIFDGDGSVRCGDGDSECTLMGSGIDPCFITLREARKYVREQIGR